MAGCFGESENCLGWPFCASCGEDLRLWKMLCGGQGWFFTTLALGS